MYKIRTIILFLSLFLFTACSKSEKREVVIYTSVDQPYAEQIFRAFEKESGIRVIGVFDTEASKGVGLQNRLILEKEHPKADIFWNSEPLRTAILAQKDLFAPYIPQKKLPYKDETFYDRANHLWYGFGARYRTLVVHKDRKPELKPDHSLFQLLLTLPKNSVAISLPYAGTATTHFVALYNVLGENKFKKNIKRLAEQKPRWYSGNSLVVDAVAAQKDLVGLCDSDDVASRLRYSAPVQEVCYDQKGKGNLLIFGTVSKIKNAPHHKEAEAFLKFLLSPKTEKLFIQTGGVQAGVFKSTPEPKCKTWSIKPADLYKNYEKTLKILREILE